jgi:hypothetical protein
LNGVIRKIQYGVNVNGDDDDFDGGILRVEGFEGVANFTNVVSNDVADFVLFVCGGGGG